MKRRLHRLSGLFLVVGVSAALSACAQGQSTEAARQVMMDKERALNVNAKTSVREAVASILRGDDAECRSTSSPHTTSLRRWART